MPRFYTAAELAEMLTPQQFADLHNPPLAYRTVWRKIQSGKIKAVEIPFGSRTAYRIPRNHPLSERKTAGAPIQHGFRSQDPAVRAAAPRKVKEELVQLGRIYSKRWREKQKAARKGAKKQKAPDQRGGRSDEER